MGFSREVRPAPQVIKPMVLLTTKQAGSGAGAMRRRQDSIGISIGLPCQFLVIQS